MNPAISPSSLPPEIQSVLAAGATPLTAAQQQVFQRCLANTTCETGQGTKTLALIDDQVNPFYSIEAGEVDAQAIQSGQIAKIIHYSSSVDPTQYLSDFRIAIAQKVSLIVSLFGALGNETGPVLAQAKAAGIPVVNGAVPLEPAVANLLAVQVSATPCSMWNNAAATLAQHLKQEGKTNITYALFTGPPGNSYAASWQGCAQQDVAAQGWTKVYTGYTQWTPQGETQAASALLASGKSPDVILFDAEPDQFVQAYEAAKKTMPLIMVTGSIDIGSFNVYKQALAAGAHPDIWTNSSQVWLLRIGVAAGLEIADGHKPSANPIVYPMNAVPFSEVIGSQDLSVNSQAIAGSMLDPQEVTEALKY